ncbi:MAG TPA: guanylate kinase [Bacteroidales bacterium]|nr:guanylate kinase [Bacteroidales bacterium]
MGKLIIFSAPSGAGKTTLVKAVLSQTDQFMFSVSATSRKPRVGEVNGKDYYFLSSEEFKQKIATNEFVEYEEVYENLCYGTLKSEIERIWALGKHVVFDVDVKGGLNLKRQFGEKALALFVMPPSEHALRERLTSRATDTPEAIEMRVAKAKYELEFAPQFDIQIINDNLDVAVNQTCNTVLEFIKNDLL